MTAHPPERAGDTCVVDVADQFHRIKNICDFALAVLAGIATPPVVSPPRDEASSRHEFVPESHNDEWCYRCGGRKSAPWHRERTKADDEMCVSPPREAEGVSEADEERRHLRVQRMQAHYAMREALRYIRNDQLDCAAAILTGTLEQHGALVSRELRALGERAIAALRARPEATTEAKPMLLVRVRHGALRDLNVEVPLHGMSDEREKIVREIERLANALLDAAGPL